jgi:hypothetical protein
MATAVGIKPTTNRASEAVSWRVLLTSSFWKRLTSQRKVWVAAFLTMGDALVATRMAYHCKSEKNARCMTYELRKHKDIVACLEFFKGPITRDEFMLELKETIQRAEPGSVAQVRAQSLYARLAYGDSTRPRAPQRSKSSSDAPAKFKVGDICVQDHKTFRVTSIDADGKPMTAEEVE